MVTGFLSRTMSASMRSHHHLLWGIFPFIFARILSYDIQYTYLSNGQRFELVMSLIFAYRRRSGLYISAQLNAITLTIRAAAYCPACTSDLDIISTQGLHTQNVSNNQLVISDHPILLLSLVNYCNVAA